MQSAPKLAFCNTSTCTKLPKDLKTCVLSIFEWPLKTGFTVYAYVCLNLFFPWLCHLLNLFKNYPFRSILYSSMNMIRPRGYKLLFILKLKKSAMISCLRTRVRKQPIIALYFEFETLLKLYNLGACRVSDTLDPGQTRRSVRPDRGTNFFGKVVSR